MPDTSQYGTTNYLVPAGGGTHAVVVKGNFSATPTLVDWRQFKIDAFPFQPQGLFADNSQGTTDLVISILPIAWDIHVAPGTRWQGSFPAPNGQTATITGDVNNVASVVFVDFPVFENSSANGGSAVVVSNANPINVFSVPMPAENQAASITGAATDATLTPAAANKKLRRLQLSLSGNASLAVAGTLTITATANGLAVYTATVWLAAAPIATAPPIYDIADIDFGDIQFPMLAGDLDVTISTALNTGTLAVNGWFSA